MRNLVAFALLFSPLFLAVLLFCCDTPAKYDGPLPQPVSVQKSSTDQSAVDEDYGPTMTVGPKLDFGPSLNMSTGELEIGPSLSFGPNLGF